MRRSALGREPRFTGGAAKWQGFVRKGVLLCLALLLSACGGSPGAAEIAPTSKPLASVAQAGQIYADGSWSWSPDEQWLAYVTFPQAGSSVGQKLLFYNANSRKSCLFPHPLLFPTTWPAVYWFRGKVVVEGEGTTWMGAPCVGPFEQLDDSIRSELPDPSVSPGGNFRAVTRAVDSQGTPDAMVTTLEDLHTGKVATKVDWAARVGEGQVGLGGKWITGDLFLIPATGDEGPLLVPAGERAVKIAPELFGVAPVYRAEGGDSLEWVAEGIGSNDGSGYHLVLFNMGTEVLFEPVRIFHSETGQIETLAYKHLWTPAVVSADGVDWLLLLAPANGAASGRTNELWIRPLDPAGKEVRKFYEGKATQSLVSPDGRRVAFDEGDTVKAYAFPSGALLGSWTTEGYPSLRAAAWSPAGRYLALLGSSPERAELLIATVSGGEASLTEN